MTELGFTSRTRRRTLGSRRLFDEPPRNRCPTLFLLLAGLMLAGCEETAVKTPERWTDAAASPVAPVSTRWYSSEQVKKGAELFQANCARCHGANGEGAPDWRSPGADGKSPPPPLNGTAHAWHHPLKVLRQAVKSGGMPLGGSMPGFAGKLDEDDIDAVLAWVQSHWPDEIYAMWRERDAQSKN